jgi:hypothetical protein
MGGINLYGFVGNNPVNEVDPLGFDSDSWWNVLPWWKNFLYNSFVKTSRPKDSITCALDYLKRESDAHSEQPTVKSFTESPEQSLTPTETTRPQLRPSLPSSPPPVTPPAPSPPPTSSPSPSPTFPHYGSWSSWTTTIPIVYVPGIGWVFAFTLDSDLVTHTP